MFDEVLDAGGGGVDEEGLGGLHLDLLFDVGEELAAEFVFLVGVERLVGGGDGVRDGGEPRRDGGGAEDGVGVGFGEAAGLEEVAELGVVLGRERVSTDEGEGLVAKGLEGVARVGGRGEGAGAGGVVGG